MNGVAPVLRFPGASPRDVDLASRGSWPSWPRWPCSVPPTPGRADGPLSDLLASVSVGSRAHDIVIDTIPGVPGTYAFVATDRGLTILDISNPANPTVRGSELVGELQRELHARSRGQEPGAGQEGPVRLPGGAGSRGCRSSMSPTPITLRPSRTRSPTDDPVNRPDPRSPALAPQRGKIYHIAVHPTADAAYAASYNGELYVWDISTPAAPVLTQTLGVMLWGGGVCPRLRRSDGRPRRERHGLRHRSDGRGQQGRLPSTGVTGDSTSGTPRTH